MMNRRKFIYLAGGGIVLAATTTSLAGCSLRSDYPVEAVEIWNGPQEALDARRWALAYAITAPNPHNLQPWIADLREPNVITLRTDPKRILPHTDPLGRQILIGHGAFLELLVIALSQKGIASDVTLWPEGELGSNLQQWDQRPIARITLHEKGAQDPLFAQILQRHTPKSDFDTNKPVDGVVLQQLLKSTESNTGIRSGGTIEVAQLSPYRELCWQAAQVELTTSRTVMESIHLTRVGPTEILQHRDGISLNSLPVRILDTLGLFDRKNPPEKDSQAYKAMMSRYQGFSQSAMGFVWLSGKNHRSDQVQAGRAYVRMQLRATELGIGMHPLSQALQEFPEMQAHYVSAHQITLNRAAPRSADDETLQMYCRIGYPLKPASATPRRPMEQFIRV
jgi:hypothetical protein